jgi:anti-sigma factor RsiW
MSEEIHEQISAFLDDELSPEESAFLVRRLDRDADARNQFIRYALVGSALRGDLLHADSSPLRRRIMAALDGKVLEGVAAAPTPREPSATFSPSVAGFGVAALVAVVAIVGLRALNLADSGDPSAAVAAGASSSALEPRGYVVSQDYPEWRVITPPIRMTNYLVQHGSVASMLSRTSINSNVVGVMAPEIEEQPAQGNGADQ